MANAAFGSLPAAELLLQSQHLRLLLRRQQLYLLRRERHHLLQQGCKAGQGQGKAKGSGSHKPAASRALGLVLPVQPAN